MHQQSLRQRSMPNQLLSSSHVSEERLDRKYEKAVVYEVTDEEEVQEEEQRQEEAPDRQTYKTAARHSSTTKGMHTENSLRETMFQFNEKQRTLDKQDRNTSVVRVSQIDHGDSVIASNQGLF